MAHLVEVAFKGNRKEFFLWDYPDPPALKSAIIVDADRGEDLGYVHALGELAQIRNGGCAHGCGTSAPTRKALRLASTRDKATAQELQRLNDDARHKAMERVKANGLAMKLSDAEWQWDRKKLTFYFTAEKRVDFRNLVRDLASLFRTRIELKQIGVRDEARRLDGIGRCGRQYCSASWLPELRPVNLGVAKDQKLSLNPAQISGACGRLMCCLRYEHDFYVQSRKRFPKEGKIIATAAGEERVLAIDIFREQLTLRTAEGETRVVALADFNREIAGLTEVSVEELTETAEDEPTENGFEVSPELLYTSEYEVTLLRQNVVAEAEAQPAPDSANEEGDPDAATRAGDRDDSGAKRRRGRRGGRRGRGGEQGRALIVGRFYLTTAIDYANGDPHLGHAFEKIGADVIARYRRLCGDDVHFLIGMDEHGQKVAAEAADRGVAPQALVDEVASRFQRMWKKLSISNDQFIRTTEETHRKGVASLIERIFEKSPGDFFEKEYEGWYCVGCESFKQDNEIIQGKCILHPTRTLQWVAEKNWFFKLSAYTDRLRELISTTDFLGPKSRRNEMLALLDQGLDDISASRSRFSWGVPFPRPSSDGETQTTYVWFDALPNYLTATGYPDPSYTDRWPADLHVIGKDITRFHSIIWPAMLMAAGLEVPRMVWAHGFVLLAGDRFSKSAGVRLELDDAIDRYGPDAFRYFLMREVPFDADGNFSWERFEERYNADLANAWGNLASRTIAMIDRYRRGVIPAGSDSPTDKADAADFAAYHSSLDGSSGYFHHDALRALWRTVARANEFVDRQAPWKLAKDETLSAELDRTLGSLARQLARQAVYISPFMPERAQDVWTQLGGAGSVHDQRFDTVSAVDPTGWKVTKGAPLFPKEQK